MLNIISIERASKLNLHKFFTPWCEVSFHNNLHSYRSRVCQCSNGGDWYERVSRETICVGGILIRMQKKWFFLFWSPFWTDYGVRCRLNVVYTYTRWEKESERGRQIWQMTSKLLHHLNSLTLIVASFLFLSKPLTRPWKLLAQLTSIDKFNNLNFYYKFWHSNSWICHFLRQQDNTFGAIHLIRSSLVYFPTTTTITTRRNRAV